jgi:hypothetical protein
MKASPILWVLPLAVACAHPHQPENASQESSGSERATADAGPPSAASPAASSKDSPSGSVLRGSGDVMNSSGTPLGTSANALLQPGAEHQVREKLGLPEHGGSLNQAVMKFQREHDLPATGVLDHTTARALGLDPEQIFRKSESN